MVIQKNLENLIETFFQKCDPSCHIYQVINSFRIEDGARNNVKAKISVSVSVCVHVHIFLSCSTFLSQAFPLHSDWTLVAQLFPMWNIAEVVTDEVKPQLAKLTRHPLIYSVSDPGGVRFLHTAQRPSLFR